MVIELLYLLDQSVMSYNDISQQWQQENEELRHLSEEITQIDLGL
jgi:hypothetical protein